MGTSATLWRLYGCRTLTSRRQQKRRVDGLFAGWPGAEGLAEVVVLECLRCHGPQDVLSIAQRIDRSEPAVRRLIQRMRERGGLIVQIGKRRILGTGGRSAPIYRQTVRFLDDE